MSEIKNDALDQYGNFWQSLNGIGCERVKELTRACTRVCVWPGRRVFSYDRRDLHSQSVECSEGHDQ